MKRLLLPAVLVLAATGCAAQSPAGQAESVPSVTSAPATQEPVVMTPGTYEFESVTGAKGSLEVPGKPAAEIEALRAIGKGPAVTYLTAKVDNRKGSAYVNMYEVSVIDPGGKEYKYTNADQYISAITPSNAPAETYNKFIHAGNKYIEGADPGTVKEFVLTGPALPKEFSIVRVYPSGMSDPVDALPKS